MLDMRSDRSQQFSFPYRPARGSAVPTCLGRSRERINGENTYFGCKSGAREGGRRPRAILMRSGK
jgi:hypothetical protein